MHTPSYIFKTAALFLNTDVSQFYKATILISVLLGIIIVFFFTSIIRHQRHNLRLYKAKVKAEISTLEKERKRIASDLHDELGPLLSAVKLQINSIESEDNNTNDHLIERSNRQIDDVIRKMKDISNNLLPNTLVRRGLEIAVNEFVEKMAEVHPLKISFKVEGKFTLNQDQEINIYRIIQEITHNTIKHSGGTLLIIKLKIIQNKLMLITSDNGTGFDIENEMNLNTGLGLLNLRSRAEVLGANLSYTSDKGTGTSYIFEVQM
jgi:two-component system, NarL family, sensor kinase